MLLERLEKDLKKAALAGDKKLVSTLRLLKNAIQYAQVEKRGKNQPFEDKDVVDVLFKEAKKRQESADIYQQAGNSERAQAEVDEKKIIENYLPQQMSEDEIKEIINQVIGGMGEVTKAQMGQIIGQVKAQTGSAADGATIAKLVNKALINDQ